MTDKELQKLKRPELLEIMLSLKSSLKKEKEENEKIKEQLSKKNIVLENSGNIAEAALELSGIFNAAQQAANVYLKNIQKMHDEQEAFQNELIENAKREAEKIISAARAEAADIKNKAEFVCRNKIKMTDEECQKKIINTNNICQEKIKEIHEKCTAIYSLNNHVASFFNDDN